MSHPRARVLPALCAALLGSACAVAGCAPKIVAWNCANADCKPFVCGDAEQHLPADCDAASGKCRGIRVGSDEAACDACNLENDALDVPRGPHMRCACQHCAVQLMACRESARYETHGDSKRDDKCRAVIDCGLANSCTGTECYCGKDVDQVTCLDRANHGGSLGVCAETIAAAAGCDKELNQGDCVLGQRFSADSAIARAVAVSDCTTGDPVYGVDGYCPFEAFPVRDE